MMDFISEYREYFITAAIGFAVTVWICISKGIFVVGSLTGVVTILSDAFFIPGVLCLCLGLILYATNEGLFNAMAYGMKILGRSLTGRKGEKIIDEEFHEYHSRLSQKKSKVKHFLIVGAVNVVISIIFVIVYFFV